jgi:hypothetical protein
MTLSIAHNRESGVHAPELTPSPTLPLPYM